MHWEDETGTDVLQRIVMLLLSLADLSELAAGRSLATRRRVMWALWHANAVVTEFVTAAVDPPATSPAEIHVRQGDDPADAMALAVSLRWLALVVHGMAARQRRLTRTHPGSASRKACRAVFFLIQSLLVAASLLPERRDTS